MDWLTAGAQVLGGIAGSFVGGSMDRHFDQKARSDHWDFMEDKGLTPQEIAGAGAAGSSRGSGASSVLGNQAAELARIRQQQQYDEKQRDIDRAVVMRGQDNSLQQTQIAANASMQSSRTSADASIFSAQTQERIAQGRLALERDRFENISLPQALNDLVTSTPEWKRQQLLASMGVDNIIGTLIAGARGLDVMDPESLKRLSDAEFRSLVTDIYGLQSNVFSEAAGLGLTVNNNLRDILGTGSSADAPSTSTLGGGTSSGRLDIRRRN